DYSGLVQTQVVECISRGPVTGNISGGCSVSPDYVLIGGGAQDVWSQPGALLWESRPQDVHNSGPGTTWLASSKDHLSAANHTLHIWAVGLKLKRWKDGTFLTHDELKSHITYSRVTSSQANHPSAACVIPSGKYDEHGRLIQTFVIGGGARANWQV